MPPSNVFNEFCFTLQADTVMGMLTVRENIQFSAALRLGNSVTPEKQKQRVDEVIEDLGLQKCADSKVGYAGVLHQDVRLHK